MTAPTRWTMSCWCCSRTGRWTIFWVICTGQTTARRFEGVIGKDLSNPIPEWAEHGAERKTVPYTVADGHGRAEPGLG